MPVHQNKTSPQDVQRDDSNPKSSVRNRTKRFAGDREGNVAIFASAGIPAVLIGAAVAISFSTQSSVKGGLQDALDAAVLAGATEIGSGKPVETAERVFLASLGDDTRKLAVDLTAKFQVNGAILSGSASGNVKNTFGGVLGAEKSPVAVSSAASQQQASVCVLGLNEFDKGSFDINGNPVFNASCAVQANSGHTSGMTQEGKAVVSASRFGVSGKQKTNNFQPAPVEGTSAIADPFASLPFPSYSTCGKGKSGLVVKEAADLSPGTYCGGITVNGANVTLKPGIYVMVNGSFLVQGGGAVSGTEVMIGFTGSDSTLRLWGNSSLTLTSPTSGTYANMQFMVDRNSIPAQHAWVSIGGSNGNPDGTPKLTYDGVAYFGKQNFWIFGNAVVNGNSPNLTVVADKIWVQGSATVNLTNNNPRGLDVPAAPKAGTASVRLLR